MISSIKEGSKILNMSYDFNRQRVIQFVEDTVQNTFVKKRYFNTIFEQIEKQDGSKMQLHYLTGPASAEMLSVPIKL